VASSIGPDAALGGRKKLGVVVVVVSAAWTCGGWVVMLLQRRRSNDAEMKRWFRFIFILQCFVIVLFYCIFKG